MHHKWIAGKQPITHRMKHVIRQFNEMKKTKELEGKFIKPKDLTILTCHDYNELPIFEQNLQFLGIKDYVVLKETRKPWRYAYKIEKVYKYLIESKNRTEYVLFCDARDVIIRDDPQKIVDIFKSKNCDLLFNATMSNCDWRCMLDVYEWTIKNDRNRRFLNSGVFIGKWDFMIEFFKEANSYVTSYSVTPEEYRLSGKGHSSDKLCKLLPEFPKGAPDQAIFRYLYPKYYPRMQIDKNNSLVYRN